MTKGTFTRETEEYDKISIFDESLSNLEMKKYVFRQMWIFLIWKATWSKLSVDFWQKLFFYSTIFDKKIKNFVKNYCFDILACDKENYVIFLSTIFFFRIFNHFFPKNFFVKNIALSFQMSTLDPNLCQIVVKIGIVFFLKKNFFLKKYRF